VDLIETEDLFIAAMYDYAFLDRHLLSGATHRLNFVIEFPIFSDQGHRIETIKDTFVLPDLVHTLLVTVSFLEKAMKYAIVLLDPSQTSATILNFGHNLKQISIALVNLDKDFANELHSTGLQNIFDELIKIDYTTLRYMHKPNPEFEIDTILLIQLNKVIYNYLRRLKYASCYSNKTTQRQIQEHHRNNNKIQVFGGIVESPADLISAFDFNQIEQVLTTLEVTILKLGYEQDSNGDWLLKKGLSSQESLRLFALQQKADHVFPDFTKLRFSLR